MPSISSLSQSRENAGFECPPESSVTIHIDNMTFAYGAFPILNGIDVTIDKPELISILGPNGVGKSTLIRCMNRILKPNEGCVTINGVDVQEINLKSLAKVLGYVPCATESSFPISVVDSVLMGRFPHQKYGSTDHDLEVVYETLDKLGIADLAMRQINEVSAGQLQKIMLARGLAQEPRVLLLDEPTANLDIRHQLNVTRLLKEISANDGVTVVMICHDINIAAKYSDEIILMYQGKIYATGTPEEVITEENLETVYGVKSKVVTDMGRPHVILRDDDEESLRTKLRFVDAGPDDAARRARRPLRTPGRTALRPGAVAAVPTVVLLTNLVPFMQLT